MSLPSAGYSEAKITNTSEKRFVEPWSERKARRADEVRRAVQQVRDGASERYLKRLELDLAEADLRRRAQMEAEERQSIQQQELTAAQKEAKIQALLRTASASLMPRWRSIMLDVAKAHGLHFHDFVGRSRVQRIVFARQEVMWRFKHELGWSLPEIGRRLGGRDHTTVLHGVRQHQRRIDSSGAGSPAP